MPKAGTGVRSNAVQVPGACAVLEHARAAE